MRLVVIFRTRLQTIQDSPVISYCPRLHDFTDDPRFSKRSKRNDDPTIAKELLSLPIDLSTRGALNFSPVELFSLFIDEIRAGLRAFLGAER